MEEGETLSPLEIEKSAGEKRKEKKRSHHLTRLGDRERKFSSQLLVVCKEKELFTLQ
jgi:hypothetical protein